MILNNLKTITRVDKGLLLRHISGFSEQCQRAVDIAKACPNFSKPKKVQNIVILGMGGSAIGGDVLKTLFINECPIPIIVNRNYDLPQFVNEKSLVFAVSYSGNTEETLTAFKEVLKRKSKVVVITSGGRLAFLANRQKVPLVKIPSGIPPRAAMGYLFFPMIVFLQKWNIIENQTLNIIDTINAIQKLEEKYNSQKSTPGNRAKELAAKLHKKIPLIIGIENSTDVVALRWKCQLNENSKNLAFAQFYPELGHNEIEGWKGIGKFSKNFVGLFLRKSDESEDSIHRIDVIKTFLKNHVSEIIDVKEQGSSRLTQIFSLCHLGDYVSFYLSVLNKVDPTPVSNVDALKDKLRDQKRMVLKKSAKAHR